MEQKENFKKFINYFQKHRSHPNFIWPEKDFIYLKKSDSFSFDCFLWQKKNLYIDLFLSFINFQISDAEFCEKLISLRFKHISSFAKWESNLNSKSIMKLDLEIEAFEFQEIVDKAYEYCDLFIADEDLQVLQTSRNLDEIDGAQLRQKIKDLVLEIT